MLYLFNIVPYVVESGSMEPTIETGSLSFINKKFKYENIKEQDIISFKLSSGNNSVRVMHRVIEVTDKGFITKGDANENSDGLTTTKENYEGKNVFSIPKLGYFIKFIQTTKGKIILSILIVIIFVSSFLIKDDEKVN